MQLLVSVLLVGWIIYTITKTDADDDDDFGGGMMIPAYNTTN